MTENIDAIVLSRVRYSDKGNVLAVFTRQYGRLAFALSAGGSKRSASRHTCMLPLACVNIRMHYRRNADLQHLGGIELAAVHHSLYADPRKQILCMFLAEFLDRLLRQQPADEPLWQFLSRSVQYLDLAERGVANFHIAMLSGLTYFLGIQPDMSEYAPNRVFDMAEGRFRTSAPLHRHWIQGEEAEAVRLLTRLNYANMHCLRLNRERRNRLLDGLLRYYDLHFPGIANLKSLDVLRVTMTGLST